MNTNAILALLGDLYAQVSQLSAENTELKAELSRLSGKRAEQEQGATTEQP